MRIRGREIGEIKAIDGDRTAQTVFVAVIPMVIMEVLITVDITVGMSIRILIAVFSVRFAAGIVEHV